MIKRASKILSVVLVSFVFALACSSGQSTAGKATLTADPNPVAGGAGWGTTTVKWDTGDNSWGQVYVFVKGRDEVLFIEGPSGSKQAPWISIGPEYQFRLYEGKDHKVLLASVTVTRSQP